MTAHDSQSPRLANVLLVEDNEADITLTRALFDYEGIKVSLDAVQDGDQALHYLHRNPPYETAPRPDLILMDLNMPRVDGGTVIEEIRRRDEWRAIPVVVLSGLDTRGFPADPVPGVQGCISKPIHYETLRAVVDTLPGLEFETADHHHYLYCRDAT